MKITLTKEEMQFAGFGGVMRQVDALEKGRKDQFEPRGYWETHILSSMAECAVAKWRNKFWSPFYDAEHPPGAADLGTNGEIRSSPNPASPLTLRPRDQGKGEKLATHGGVPASARNSSSARIA